MKDNEKKTMINPKTDRNTPEDDTIFDVEGLAQYLKVSKQWVYEKVHQNAIPHFKMGKYPRFRKFKIDAWLRTMEKNNGKTHSKTVRRLLEDTS